MRRSGVLLVLFLGLRALCGARAQEKPGLLELTADSFVSTFKELPEDRWVLLEFYAHWCPACQRFQPEYEKVAAFFAERGEKEPIITVARLDCANHGDLCSTFKVTGYPTMKLGTAADVAALAVEKPVNVQPASRHADAVIAFVAKHLDVTFETASSSGSSTSGGDAISPSSSGSSNSRKLNPGGGSRKINPGGIRAGAGGAEADSFESHEHATGAADAGGRGTGSAGAVGHLPGGADLSDIEGATVKSWQYIVASPLLLKGAEARQGLKDWVGLLADNHPVNRCRTGAERVREALEELWPDDQDQPIGGLGGLHICPGSTFKGWRSCRGSSPETRGYTCALWQLLHTLASRLPETENSGAVWLAAVKGFVGSYFQCTDCAKHFMAHAAGEQALAVADKRSACLWIWRTHNIVNRRLVAEDKPADPGSHIQFPPASLCPQCRVSSSHIATGDDAVSWDEDEVYKFLLAYYSGNQPEAMEAGGGLRARRSGWSDAALLVVLVGGCVYVVLRRSTQYGLRKVESRSL